MVSRSGVVNGHDHNMIIPSSRRRGARRVIGYEYGTMQIGSVLHNSSDRRFAPAGTAIVINALNSRMFAPFNSQSYDLTGVLAERNHMLRSKIVSIVDICTRFPWAIIAITTILTVVTAIYSVS